MEFRHIVQNFINILQATVFLLMALGLLYFMYGLVMYIFNSGDAGKRADSRKFIMHGLIGLFVMTAVWGLLAVFTQTIFGVNPLIPQISL